MSAISSTATGEVFNQEGGGFLVIMTINHSSLASPICVVNNNVDIVSNGVSYSAFPFRVTLPEEKDQTAPAAKLTIDNVSRAVSQLLRLIATPPTVAISVIRISDLNAVEVTLPVFKLRNTQWDALTVTGDLLIDDITSEPFPARSFTPAEYPGIF